MVGSEEREFPFKLIPYYCYIIQSKRHQLNQKETIFNQINENEMRSQQLMGGQQTKIKQRQQPPQVLDKKITSCIQNTRLKLSHQSNVWKLCHRLREYYNQWQISEIYLDNNMIAGEVIQEISKINFQKSNTSLKALTLSHNDIICDNLKYFRTAFFGTLVMLHLDHNRIGSDGCFYLSKTNLPKLQTLDLSFNLINQSGAGHLANSNLPKLLNLVVNKNQLNIAAIYAFSRAQWPSLALFQAKQNLFEPNNELQSIKFRTQVKMFRLQLR